MELSTFITETLNSITKGIKDSQPFALENGAIVNPILHPADKASDLLVLLKNVEGARPVTKVDFDISVTVESSTSGGIKGGINVYAISLSAKKADNEKSESISRIKFSINTVFLCSDPNSESLQLL